jgi:hypothetical protein
MPRNLTPEDRWETDFQVPVPGDPRRIGPLEVLFQRLLNRTERLKNRIAAILGTAWDATPPDTLAGLAGRVSMLEGNQGGTTLSAHRTAPVLDHPDGSVTAAKLAPVRDAPTVTPSPGDWLLGGLASGTGVGKVPIGQANGVPLLNVYGALASADAYLSRGAITSAVDWNTLTNAGTYEIASGAFGTGSANTPPAVTQQGHLLVLKTSGATTQVYVPQGGDPGIYWRQYAGGAWSSWATASVMYGSNSNGSYIRFADGTQICWASHSDSSFGSVSTGDDANYKYRTKTWAFPAAFTAAPAVQVSGDVAGARVDVLNTHSVTTTQCTLEVGQYNTSGVTVSACHTLAIGRWK